MNVNRYKEAITVARDAIGEMDTGDPLRTTAFTEVLRVALSENRTESRGSENSRADVAVDEASDDFQRIAEYLKISEEAANAVFDLSTGAPRLKVLSDQLPEAKKTATQQIALVLCAAREGLGLDATTTTDVREQCVQYGKFDGPNFAAALKAIPQWLILKPIPKTKDKQLVLLVPGREEAERVVQRWAGEDDSS